MEALNNAGLGARRNEDIALDLLKFVAGTAGVGRPAVGATGFSGAAAPKPEEHVAQLLQLYSRCLKRLKAKEHSNPTGLIKCLERVWSKYGTQHHGGSQESGGLRKIVYETGFHKRRQGARCSGGGRRIRPQSSSCLPRA